MPEQLYLFGEPVIVRIINLFPIPLTCGLCNKIFLDGGDQDSGNCLPMYESEIVSDDFPDSGFYPICKNCWKYYNEYQ